tara:strand:- start:1557 stop:3155 length:1599 start_codon:yes stop_codon:yes gene_type:complete
MPILNYTTEVKELMLSMSLDVFSSSISNVNIGFGHRQGYSGSIYPSSSFSGSVILPYDSNTIIPSLTPAIKILLPSSSYLDTGSKVSASLGALTTKYEVGGTHNPNRYELQFVENATGYSSFPCNTTDCYPGEVFWTFDFVSVNSPTSFSPSNRNLHRPLKGGISISSTSNTTPFASQGSMGTMGGITQDSASNALVGLTNNHVVIRDAFYTNQRTLTNPQNEYDLLDPSGNSFGTNTPPTSYTQLVYQDAETGAANSAKEIGRVIRYVPLYTSASTVTSNGALTNKVDGAIFSLYCSSSTSTIIDFTSSYQQLGFTSASLFTSSLPFATTNEIDGMINPTSSYYNPPLYSSGRTTGPKGEDPCPLRISGFTNAIVGYNLQGNTVPAFFEDLIEFVKPEDSGSYAVTSSTTSTVCPWPGWKGDSGSTLIADFSGSYKIIGLVFAGNGGIVGSVSVGSQTFPLYQASSHGLACRIDHVASELGIKAWTGSVAPVVDHDTIDYRTVSGSNDTKILNCSGSNFYQVGLTTNHKFC